MKYPKRDEMEKKSIFEKLPDELITLIFSYDSTYHEYFSSKVLPYIYKMTILKDSKNNIYIVHKAKMFIVDSIDDPSFKIIIDLRRRAIKYELLQIISPDHIDYHHVFRHLLTSF
jgi:hypothetical protein